MRADADVYVVDVVSPNPTLFALYSLLMIVLFLFLFVIIFVYDKCLGV